MNRRRHRLLSIDRPASARRRRTVTAARRRGAAPRARAGMLVLAAWLAVAAAHAQTPGQATAPGPVGFGTFRNDSYAPGDHRYQRKFVLSHPGKLRVSWRPPASDGGSAVTGYRVYWYQTGDYAGTVQSANVAPAGTGVHAHYVTGLTNGTEYGVGVTAVNAVGEGPFRTGSGVALARLPYASPRDDMFINVPAARDNMQVGSLAAARSGANRLRVTWSLPAGTRILDHFKVSWSKAGSAAVAGTSPVVHKTATSYDITGLTGGQEYRIEVDTTYRRNAGAEASYTATGVTSATPYGAPTAPRDLAVLGNDGSLAVSWAAPAADGGSPVTGYRLAWSAAGTTGSTDLAATARAHAVPNLTNERAYTVTLTASNAYYAGPAASGSGTPFLNSVPSFGDATVAAQTRTAGLPGAPSLTLPAASGGNYGLTYSLTPAVSGLTFDPETRVLSGVAGSVGQHQMTYRVDDGDRLDTGADADTLTFTLTVNANTSPTAAPIAKSTYEDIPLTLAGSDFTGAFSDADAGDSLKSVRICPVPATTGKLTVAGAAVTGCAAYEPDDLDALVYTPAADYSGSAAFGFVLVDQVGGSADGTVTITVHPNDPPLPAASTAPYGSVAGGNTVTLTNSSRDPDGDTMTWLWEQTAGTTVTLSDATAESPTFTAPDSVGWLTFRLTATDEHGAGAADTVSLHVYTPPDAPATLTASPGDGEVTLTWTPGDGNGNKISAWQYRVSADGGSTWGLWIKAGRGMIYNTIATALRNGTSYTFAVRAGNSAGYGTPRMITATPEETLESNRYVPRARAGMKDTQLGDETVETGATVTLDASRSSDWDYVKRFYVADNVPVLEYDEEQEAEDFTYRWTQVRTSLATPQVTLDDATAMQPTFTAPDRPTALVFRLTVGDGVHTDDHEVTIRVVWPEGIPSFGTTRRLSLGLRPDDTLSRVLPAATGGTAPLVYSLTPAAPGVMAFDAAARTVTLTPAAAGSWTFDYTATDADGDADTITLAVQVAEVSTPPTFGGVSIRDLRLVKGAFAVSDLRGRPHTLPRASGGEGPLTYSLTPTVPGLTFFPRERALRGRPTTAGSYAMTYRAVDADADAGDADSATLSFTIDVVENSRLVALFPGETVSLRMKVPMAKWRHTDRELNRYPYAVDFRDYFHDPDGRHTISIAKPPHPPIVWSFCRDDPRACGYVDRVGTWTINVTAKDPLGTTATQRFHVTALPANRAPVVKRDFPSISMGRYGTSPGCTSYICTNRVVSRYFSDPDGDPLTYRAVSSNPRLGTRIHITRAGRAYGNVPEGQMELFTRLGSAGVAGNWTATVTVSATDTEGESAYIDIPVTVQNDPWEGPRPVAAQPGAPSFGDATVADRSWPKDKAIIPLLLPAATGGTTPLTYTLTPSVPGLTFDAATLTLSGTPTTVASATAMTYKVSDSAAPARTATLKFNVTITGTAVGTSAPTSAATVLRLPEDTVHAFAADQFPFSDADADEYLYKLQVETLPAKGTLRLDGVEQAAGATIAGSDLSGLEYHPPANWHGRTSFTFKVVDTTQRASTAAYHAYLVVEPVNDPPTSADLELTVAEDTALTLAATDVPFADVDGHPDTLGAVVIASLPAAAAGALTLDGTAVTAGQSIPVLLDEEDKLTFDGLQFTPAANWHGTAAFHFGVADSPGLASLDTYTATIRVTAVNDAPSTADLTRSIDEDATLTVALADFTFDDVDAGDRLKAIVFTQAPRSGEPAQPAGTLSSFHGSVETVIDSGDTVAAAGLTRLEYRPDADFSGRVTFTFQVQDAAGAVSEAATATVQVAPVADPPTSQAFTIAGDEDTAVTVAAANFVFSDPDPGDSLKAVRVVTLPDAAHGALAVDGDAVKAGDAIAASDLDSLAFTPVADWFGNAGFTFRVVDQSDTGSAAAYTATVTIAAKNDAPTAADLTRKWHAELDFAALFPSVFADPDTDDALGGIELTSTPTGGTLLDDDEEQEEDDVIAAASLSDLEFEPLAGTYRAAIEFRVRDTSGAASQDSYTLSLWWNAPPTASALSLTAGEDRALPLAASDFDAAFTDADDGDSLTAVTIGTLPGQHGKLTLNGVAATSGQVVSRADLAGLTFTPATDYAGSVTFGFRVHDRENARSGAAVATVTVTPSADPPVASALNTSTREDTALAFKANDFESLFADPDEGDSLKAVKVVTPPDAGHGVLALSGTAVTADQVVAHADLGSLTFTPVANWNGVAQIFFQLSDQTDRFSVTRRLGITVTAVADPPVAAALGKSTAEDTALTFTVADFEGVFSDGDGDSLKSVWVISPTVGGRGTLALDGTAVTANQVIARDDLGDLAYTPTANWNGRDSFTIRFMDQTDTASALADVTITVTAAADAPVAGALNVSTAEDTALAFTAAQFEGVFTDVDAGDRLKSVKVVSLPAAAHGALALDGTAVTADQVVAHADLGKLAFTPVANWSGEASFTFQVADQSDAESAAATATITVSAVNDTPAASALAVSTAEDTALAFTAAQFEGVFTDVDAGDSLKSVQVVTLPAAAHGALALGATAVTANQVVAHADLGTLTFTPKANYAGTAEFTFTVADQSDAESAAATATVTVTAVADAPAAAALGKSTAEDTALAFAASDFEGVFTDPDAGDSLQKVQVVSLPDAGHGTLSLDREEAPVLIPRDAGRGTRSLGPEAVTANQEIAQGDLANLAFTPVANWNGAATFTFKVVDQSDAASAAATATVTVNPVNDAPTAGPLGKTTAEDTELTFAAGDFTGVFTDPDAGDSLKAVRVVSLPAAGHGTLALDGEAVTANQDVAHGDLGDLAFTPAANWSGAATFDFKVVDQSDAASAAAATATITVTAVADAPVAGALHLSTAEDTVLTFTAADFEAVFTDAEGDALKSVQVASLPDAGHGTLALDGTAVATNQVIARGDLGDLAFTPVADWNGAAAFDFKVVDATDAESAQATATITVTAVADAPAASALAVSTTEDTALTFTAATFDGVFSDPDAGDSLQEVKVVSLPDAGHGTLALDGAAVTANRVIARGDLGDLAFTPVADWNGAAAFDFKVVDSTDAESANATATITVTAVADAPAAGALHLSTAEDTVLTLAAATFDGVFSDPDAGDGLKAVQVVSLPDAGHGTLALDGTAVTADQAIARGDLGDLAFTPVANWNGAATFDFKVVDSTDAASAQATATITVTAVADAPAAGALAKSMAEDTVLTFAAADFEGVFTDPDAGDGLKRVKVVSLPAATEGFLRLDEDVTANQVIAHGDLGTLAFKPEDDFTGAATFSFQVSDRSDRLSATATATITVIGANDRPAAAALARSTAEDTVLTFAAADFEGVFTDPDAGDSLKAVQVVSLPDTGHGHLALDGEKVTADQEVDHGDLGDLTFTPAANWHGQASFTFKVVDQSDAESLYADTATVTVTAVADPPAAGPLARSTAEDTVLTLVAGDFESVFTDPDAGDSMTAVKVVSLPAATAGALALGGNAVSANQVITETGFDTKTLTFTPVADFVGEATFTFQVVDESDTASATATATITVTDEGDAPAAGTLAKSTAEDTVLTFAAGDFEDVFTDPDSGDSLLAVELLSLPAAAHGTLAVNDEAASLHKEIEHGDLGNLTFTPAANWNGAATFRFAVLDQTLKDSEAATATVTVTAVADAPVARALSMTATEDTELTFAASDFEGVFSDADAGDSLKAVKVVSLPAAAQGALALDGEAVSAGDVIARADLEDLVFTPAANFAGAATFGFQVSDQGDRFSATATATVTVAGTNDAPAASALNLSTTEDTALTFTAAQFDEASSDVDAGDSLKAVKVVTLPAAAHGALALDGTAVTANRKVTRADLGDLAFTPAANWSGVATFTFTVADQSDAESAAATATITVAAVADAPVAGALGVSTAEDTALTFTAAQFDAVFSDADAGDSLKAVKVVSLPAAAQGALALDGEAVSAGDVIARADLEDLVFTPAANFAGAATFGFQVSDQGNRFSATATATVTVGGTNDAPAADALNLSTTEDTALTFTAGDFEGVTADPDAGDSLKAVKVVSLPAAAHGTLALNGTAVTANRKIAHADLETLVFTPAANWSGKAAFTFTAVDQSDAESAAATATITVAAVADAPVAGALGVSTAEDTALTFTAAQFDAVFSDGDAGDSLKAVRVVTLPAATAGALALGDSAVTANDLIAHGDLGTLKFTPVGNWNGKATFTFKVADQSDAESAAATATITVSAANDAPAAAALGVSTTEDTVLTFAATDFEGAFSDPDSGDSLKAVRVVTLPAATAGALALGDSTVTANQQIAHGDLGTLKFTPVGNWNGQATFTFKVADQSDAESAAATATITVNAANDAPSADALAVSTTEDTALTFTAAQFDEVFSDEETADSLKAVRVVTLPAATAGALALGESAVTASDLIARGDLGTLKFTPAANWNGKATFTFKVADQSDAESGAATATITVNAAADPPAASALAVSTTEDTVLTFAATDFEGAFSDPDSGDSLKAVRVATLPAATAGALALGATAVKANDLIAHGDLGTLKFTPVANWNGQATFTFKVADQSDAESGAATATITVNAANDPPAASALAAATTEDTALTFTAAQFDAVFSDDPDPGDSLKAVRVVTLPAATAGALALGASVVTANDLVARGDLGTLKFTPAANWNGTATFTFKVADQAGAESAAATATIAVSAAADPPSASALGVSTTEDAVLTFTAAQFEGAFSDPDSGDSLKAVRVVTLPAGTAGALTLGAGAVTANDLIAHGDLGTLKFTPAANWNGQATFTFKVADQSDVESAAATATVTVNAANDAPAASGLALSTTEDTVLTFTAAQFEGAFSDVDTGDSLKSVKVVTLPAATTGALALGTSAVAANQVIAHGDLGTLKFTPAANWSGQATFTFQVVDQSDAGSGTATATVTVNAAADAPAASALNVSTAEDTALSFTAANFDGVFSDPDSGDSLKAVQVVTLPAGTAGALALGTSAVTANQVIARGSLGTLKFTPAANWNGKASFTFKVADQSGAQSAAATATITVNAANDPPAASALAVSTTEDVVLTFTAAQFDAAFSDDRDTGDSLKAVRVVTLPAGTAGALTVGASAVTANRVIARGALGTLKFTPAANWNGQATFTFKVADQAGAESAAATATVTVNAAGDAPVAGALNVSTAEETALSFTAAHFEAVYTDADGDDLKSVQVVTLPAATAGALALSGTAVAANQTIVKASLGSLTFTPVADFAGKATFTFKVVDDTDAASASATATVTVSGANDAPSARALGVSTAEDTAHSFTAAQFEGAFSDPDAGDSLKEVKVVSLPAATAGVLALNGTAVTANQKVAHASLGKLTFTPVANWHGQATFTFKVVDQSDAESVAAATATVTVTAVADAPAASALNVSTAEDTALTFTAAHFEGAFSDPDAGDSLKEVKVVTLPAATAGALALNGTAVTANQKIAHGDLGTLTFTPVANWHGQATFTFKVADQAGTESAAAATATVTVTAVNDAPAAAALGLSTAEDTALTFTAANFVGVFSDPDAGDTLKEVKVVSLPAATAGALALNGTAVTANRKIAHGDLGTLTFTPAANWNGKATFTFKVVDQSDAESGTAATVTVTVTAVADAPAASALNVSTAEDTALTFTAAQFEGAFSDPDAGDSLKSVKVVTLPAATAGALALGGTAVTANDEIAHGDLGTLTFTPVANWHGKATFTFKVADQAGTESAAAATATITVGGANDAPAASALSVSTAEDTALSFTAAQFEGVFSDPDTGDSLKRVKVVSLPAATAGALALNGTAVTASQVVAHADLGKLTFTPATDYVGTATFGFQVSDQSDRLSATATATVTVTAVADAPAASALNVSTAEDTALSFTAAQFEGVFSDPDTGDSLKAVQVVSLPDAEHGALALNGTAVTAVAANQKVAHADLGKLTFTPVANWNGAASFTFKVVDQTDRLSPAATATVTVTAVADAPAAAALAVSTAEDTALSFTAADFKDVFSDPDAGDSLKQVQVVSLPDAEHGALALNGTAVTANQAIAHGDLGTLTFTPVADWNGDASFTFKVVDQTDRSSAAATATVTVTAVADAPKGATPRAVVPGESEDPDASLLTVSTAEDTALSFTAAQFDAVFSDPDDGDSLKAVQVATLPDAGHGVLALQRALDPSATAVTAEQTIAHGDLGGLTFTPAANWHGAATFTFKLVDQSDAASDAATATITVTAVNDAPAASALNLSTAEGTALTFTAAQFEAVFTDVDDGDSLKAVQVVTLPDAAHGALALNGTAVTANDQIAHGDLGSLTFTPAAAYIGNATFTFKVVDQSAVASAAAATATIRVTDRNEGPIAPGAIPDQTATQGVPFTYTAPANVFSDPDGDTLVWTAAARGPGADEPAGEGPAQVGVEASARVRRAADQGNTGNTGNDNNQGNTGGDDNRGTTDGPLDWLSFDGATHTFDGTPAKPDVDGTTIRVIATDPSGAFAYAEFTLKVLPPVQVSVSGPAAPVVEGTSATFTVALSRAAPADVTVRWATAAGTGDDAATAGSDYTAQAPTDVTIAAGQTERSVAVATLVDNEDEDAETFTVQLSLTADGLPAGVELGTDSATASIVDTAPPPQPPAPPPARSEPGSPGGGPARDDRARVSLVSPAPVREGDTAVIEVVLSKPVAQAFTVHWTTADGTASAAGGDYEPHAAVPVTFAAGDTRRSAQVATHADYLEEGTETFLLRLGAPRPLPGGVVLGTSQVTVRIGDNRRPVADAGPDQEVDPGATVTLDGSASHDPDDDPITGYAWTQTAGIEVALDDPGSATPTFTAPELPGDVTFELVVAAGGLDSLPDAVTVTVRDLAPRFLDTVEDLTFVAESEIEPLTLPAASGGNGPLTYELTSEPAGLAGLRFDPETRVLSGTPERGGRLTFTYVAHDADANRELSDAAVLTFAVTVRDAPYRRILRPVLAAIGRATLYEARAVIGSRFERAPGGREAGSLTVAGRQAALGAAEAADTAEPAAPAEAAEAADAKWRVADWEREVGPVSSPTTVAELLSDSAFEVPLTAAVEPAVAGAAATGAPDPGPHWTLWGRGHRHGFSGEPEPEASYEGELNTAWVGLEAAAADSAWLAGVAVARTLHGSAEYAVEGGDDRGERGRVEVAVTGMYPYAWYRPQADTEYSVVLGGGQGEAVHERDGAPRETSDVTLLLGSVGARHGMRAFDGRLEVALRGDAGFAHLRTGHGEEALDELTANAANIRIGVEAAAPIALGSAELRPFVEVAGRYDDGDDVTGFGAEVAGGVRLAGDRFEVEARGRVLALHTAAGHREHGASVAARLTADSEGRGLSAELSPRWGAPATGGDALWQDYLPAAAGGGAAERPASLDGRVGYGVALAETGGVLTPFAEVGLSDGPAQRVRVGARFDLDHTAGKGLVVELSGERRESAGAAPDYQMILELRFRY